MQRLKVVLLLGATAAINAAVALASSAATQQAIDRANQQMQARQIDAAVSPPTQPTSQSNPTT